MPRTIATTITILLASYSLAIAASQPTRSVIYKTPAQGKALKLHIFEPEKLIEDRPCIVFFFGGGWTGGSARQFYQQAKEMAKLGILAISADYRTKSSHGTTPQDAVRDAKSAVQWLRKNAKELKIDPNKIIASGGSAGGHIAACTGVIDGFSNGEVSSKPNAMVLYNPVLDTTRKGYGAGKLGANKTEISPCHHIKKGIPPTLVCHGTKDTTVPFENAERFTRLMKKAGNSCTLMAAEGEKHGFFNGKEFRPKGTNKNFNLTMAATKKFLKEHKLLPKEQLTE